MDWIVLIVAGFFEVIWASLLTHTSGFTRLWPTVGFVAALAVSMYLLAVAVRTLPIGTAYAVWVGIGAVGAFVVSVAMGQETNPSQVIAMVFLVGSLVAVRLTA